MALQCHFTSFFVPVSQRFRPTLPSQLDDGKNIVRGFDNLNILHINVQCLRNKFTELEILLELYNLEVICINEHWHREQEIQFYVSYGYTMGNKFCRSHFADGGFCIFLKDNINFIPVDVSSYCVEKCCEVSAEFLTVISLYRSPNGDIDRFFL